MHVYKMRMQMQSLIF